MSYCCQWQRFAIWSEWKSIYPDTSSILGGRLAPKLRNLKNGKLPGSYWGSGGGGGGWLQSWTTKMLGMFCSPCLEHGNIKEVGVRGLLYYLFWICFMIVLPYFCKQPPPYITGLRYRFWGWILPPLDSFLNEECLNPWWDTCDCFMGYMHVIAHDIWAELWYTKLQSHCRIWRETQSSKQLFTFLF